MCWPLFLCLNVFSSVMKSKWVNRKLLADTLLDKNITSSNVTIKHSSPLLLFEFFQWIGGSRGACQAHASPKGPDSFVLKYTSFETLLPWESTAPTRSTPPNGKSWICHCNVFNFCLLCTSWVKFYWIGCFDLKWRIVEVTKPWYLISCVHINPKCQPW